MTNRLIPGTACLSDQARLESILKPMMPHSVISMHPSGRLCFCEDNHCAPIIEKSDIIPGACPDGDIEWGSYWYVSIIFTLLLCI